MKKDFPVFLTSEQLRDLANRLHAAYREECEQGECQCITVEEHEKNLMFLGYRPPSELSE